MNKPKIIVIPGSSRQGSFNTRLANSIADALRSKSCEANVTSLTEFDLPIYDGDQEAEFGVPEAVKKLAHLVSQHQGVVLVNPEFNASLSPLMKNALDWLSRDTGYDVFKNRVFALASCSPGGLGGIRCLSHARDILISIGADTISPQLAVGGAGTAFAEDGSLTNERAAGLLQNMCETLIERINASNQKA